MDGKLPKTRCWFGARSIVGGIRGWATSLEKVTLHVVQGWVKELLADCAESLLHQLRALIVYFPVSSILVSPRLIGLRNVEMSSILALTIKNTAESPQRPDVVNA